MSPRWCLRTLSRVISTVLAAHCFILRSLTYFWSPPYRSSIHSTIWVININTQYNAGHLHRQLRTPCQDELPALLSSHHWSSFARSSLLAPKHRSTITHRCARLPRSRRRTRVLIANLSRVFVSSLLSLLNVQTICFSFLPLGYTFYSLLFLIKLYNFETIILNNKIKHIYIYI